MMRRALFALVVLALSFAALTLRWASAAEPKHAPGNTLDMAIVGVPVVSHGRLVNYILVRLSLTVKPGVDVGRLSDKEPYFREALVRLGYRTPLNPADSLNRVDPDLVRAKMLPLCQAIAGADVVTGVEIKYQEPQKRLPAPTSGAKP